MATTLFCQKNTGKDQRRTIIFDHYGVPQGFAGSQAICIKKAKDGFLWIGTEQGLLRYDGHRFKTFRANPSDSTTLSSNYISKMELDRHGRLWFSAFPDINVFDTGIGKCKKVSIPTESDKEKTPKIYSFKYDERNDVMWIGTNKGLLYSQGKDIRIHNEFIEGGNNTDAILSIEIDKNGIMWLAGSKGLRRYDPKTCTTFSFHRPGRNNGKLNEDGFFSSYFDQKNDIIWIGGWVHGLMKFDIKTQKMSDYTFADVNKIQNTVLTINQSGFAGEENILWLGTNYGVKTFDILTNTFTDYKSDEHNDIKGVPGLGFCFEPTRTEGMWIGTYKGLHRYDPFKQNVKVINTSLPGGQSDWALGDVCFEQGSQRDSIIWFSIDYISFFRYDLVQKKLAPIPAVLKKYCDNVAPNTLYIDSKNILWLSSYHKGLVGYDLDEKKLILPELKIRQKEIPLVLKITEDSEGNLWLGSTSGMYIYHRGRNEISEQADIRQFLDQNKLVAHVFNFTVDYNGKVWIIATYKRKEEDVLFNFDPGNKIFNIHMQKNHPELRILKNLESIESISEEKLVLTSFNGFCVINTFPDTLTFRLFESYNDKPLGGFKNICSEPSGNVWMSTDYGVTRFNPATSTVTNFTYYNSNIGLTPNPDISYSKKTNTIFIGQAQALNTIALDSLNIAPAGKILLSDLHIDQYNLNKIPESGHVLDLNYDQNSLYFEFTNLNFTNAQNNSYQYKFGDKKGEWKVMSDNTLQFNNLGYGNYKLIVKAENSFGLKSPNEFLLYINIAPPFWRTWWFNGLIIGIISLFIYSIFKYRDVQRQKLDKLRHTLARDLHDDMGSTLSHIRMMSERESMRKEANQSFKTIADKTAEVMNNMTEIIWSINPKNDSLKNIIERIQEFAIDNLEPMGMEIYFDIDEVPGNIKLNPEHRRHFYLIFKEAINNTAKYSRATRVNFSFKMENKKMILKFNDNGLGFDPMMIKRGNGLKNMESRALALNAKININTDERGTQISLLF